MSQPWNERFRMIASVYLLLVNERGEVLLSKRQNTGFKDGEYGLPAGHVDGQEDLICAMQREASEEIGVQIEKKDLSLVHVMHRHCGDHERLDFFFLSRTWKGEVVNKEPSLCSELSFFPLYLLPDNTIDYYQQMFVCVEKKELYSVWGF